MPATVFFGQVIATRELTSEANMAVTMMYATNIRVWCPHCGEMQDGFIGNPAGGTFECDDCGKPFKVHSDADIDFM